MSPSRQGAVGARPYGDVMSKGTGRGDGTGWLTLPLMFLSSYAPLLLILAIRFDGLWLRITCGVLAAIGIIGLLLLMRLHREPLDQQGRHALTEVSGAGEGASSYLAGYLLPFVTIGNPGLTDLVAYAGFFVVAYVVTTRTGIIQVNPTLFLLGYRVDLITDERGAQRYLLSKTRDSITEGVTVRASRMNNDVLVFEGVVSTVEK